ncbi:uncharacterized protein LOC135246320 [Anguilla rostrata]|uniref:uncharacterized protein LOC135246320 n=1 Tax=Anguilla rostrata TaxID=7938 RepID=UPI0030CC578E
MSIEESVILRCRRPDSAPASHCTFTTNQRGPISGSDCNRSVTGAELLSRSHSARNEITMTCFYRLEEGVKPTLRSDPSTVTVLDLRKPKISVSTEHTETRIRCEAPPDITGAKFFLYSNRSITHTKETQAGTEKRAVSFTDPRRSGSILTYCCSYQFKTFNSKLSDCAKAKNKDQSGRTKDQRSTTTDNPQTADAQTTPTPPQRSTPLLSHSTGHAGKHTAHTPVAQQRTHCSA